MIRLIVTANGMGVPMAWVPVRMLPELTERFPAKVIVTAFATHEVQVSFHGRDAAAVQEILDELSAATISSSEAFVPWPGLRLDGREGAGAPAKVCTGT